MGCPKKDERKHVVIEVINPLTGEPLERDRGIELAYDGQPKILEVKLKTEGKKGKYLTDEDFFNRDLKRHLRMVIQSKGVVDIEDGWPVERGIYNIIIDFNYASTSAVMETGSTVIDQNYYVSSISFTIYII